MSTQCLAPRKLGLIATCLIFVAAAWAVLSATLPLAKAAARQGWPAAPAMAAGPGGADTRAAPANADHSPRPAQVTASPGRFTVYLPFAVQGRPFPAEPQVRVEGGLLRIRGTARGDDLRLGLDAGGSNIEVDNLANGPDSDFSFRLADVTGIVVELGDGDDTFIIDDTNGSLGSLLPLQIEAGGGRNLVVGSTGRLSPAEVAALPVTLPATIERLAALRADADTLQTRADALQRAAVGFAATDGAAFVDAAEASAAEAQALLIDPAEALAASVEAEGPAIVNDLEVSVTAVVSKTQELQSRLDAFQDGEVEAFRQGVEALTEAAVAAGDDDEASEAVATQIDVLSDAFIAATEAEAERAESDLAPVLAVLDGQAAELAQWTAAVVTRTVPIEIDGAAFSARIETGLAGDGLEERAEAIAQEAAAIESAADALVLEVERVLTPLAGLFEAPAATMAAHGRSSFRPQQASACSTTTNTIAGAWVLIGTAANDLMIGSSSADWIFGLGGDDSLYGHGGVDWLFGNAGNDCLFGQGDTDFMFGGTGDEATMDGGAGNDLMFGNGGGDTMRGGDEIDLMFGNAGDDTMHGNKGQTLTFTIGNVTITVDLGDFMFGGPGSDTMHGDEGIDYLWGGAADDVLHGNDCLDFLWGNDGADTLHGGVGKCISINGNPLPLGNFMWGNADDDTLHGGVDHDFLWGNAGNDSLHGAAGLDFLWGNDGDDALSGDDGMDFLWGNAGTDTLHGNAGLDFLWGNTGSDTLSGDDGTDFLWGNDGDDTLDGNDGLDFLWGNAGNDTLNGNDGSDFLWGNAGNDSLNGNGGTDFLWGNADDDTLQGNDGLDFLWGNDGCDSLHGGAGIDFLWGNAGNDHLNGNAGADFLWGNDGDDTLHGNDGFDFLWGNDGDDSLHGDAGSDAVWGGSGKDCLAGGAGADLLWGGDGDDTVNGDAGMDLVWGNAGNDRLYGGADSDLVWGNQGDDVVCGNDGNDLLWGNDGTDTLNGDGGKDLLFGNDGADSLVGGPGNDLLFGNSGDDALCGAGDADLLFGNDGDDRMDGGVGNDLLFGNQGHDTQFGGADRDLVFGNQGDDRIDGGDGNDRLFGNQGDDTMYGGPGNDHMWGNQGYDTMFGGSGTDLMWAGLGGGSVTQGGSDTSPFPALNCASTCVPTTCERTVCDGPTPTPTPTPRVTISPTPSSSPTPTPRVTISATPTPSLTPIPGVTISATPSHTPTWTPIISPSPTSSHTPTRTPTAPPAPTCVQPPTGMLAWWKLDEATGAANQDLAAANNQGTPLSAGGGPLPASVPAMVGPGLSFAQSVAPSGPLSYVEVADHAELNFGTGDFSIDAWIQLGSAPAGGIYPIVDKIGLNQGYALFVQNGQLLLRIGPDDFGGLVGAVSTATMPMVPGPWYHITATVRRVNPSPIVTFYVDGVQVGSGPPAGPGMAATNSIDNTVPLWIGGNSRLAGGGATVTLNEITIDELEFFDRELGQQEILGLVNAGGAGKCPPPPTPSCLPLTDLPGLAGWWRFDEGSGETARDAIANPVLNHGQIAGLPATWGPGRVGQALSFNGTSTYVEVPHHASLDFGASPGGDFTLDAWVRLPAAANTGMVKVLLNKQATSGGPGYQLYLWEAQPGLQLADDGDYTNFGSGVAVPKDDQWHLVAVTVDRDAPDGIRFYLDGAPIGTPHDPMVRPGSLANNAPLRIGSLSFLVGSQFHGWLDEVEVMRTALSASQVTSLYQAGAAGKCPPTPTPPPTVPPLFGWQRGRSQLGGAGSGR